MSLDLSALASQPRLLLEVPLKPLQGSRFQPTGFPDLGAATYEHNQVNMLLVESAQSMANRLEAVCWDEAADDLVATLKGLPYVKSVLPDGTTTNSILEAHRLNSPYIVKSSEFEKFQSKVGFEANKPFNRKKLAEALLMFDPCSLIHGIFLEKIGGVVRLPRILSAFIEASKINVVANGGVKVDRIQPSSAGDSTAYGKAKDGYGNVPYHRDEYVAEEITAFFNLDLAQLRGYGLPTEAETLLIALSLVKIQKFLRDGLRLRTACDLEPAGTIVIKRPEGFTLPTLDALEKELPALIKAAAKNFADPVITEVKYTKA
ncbi:MAG: type I-U CRISPR-associated RAMP protein Csb1/Cas7u [Pirellulaceae bacterium]|nr:type I-U CRISPR-associated RAMP protein Csb1/Cas7u [Pirellulaceae bacterium]